MPAVGKPLLELMIERVRRSRYIDEVVVATTINANDDPIVDMCQQVGIVYFRGSEENVLERVVEAGRSQNATVSVLLTGDCPLIDPYVIDQCICAFLFSQPHIDYVTNAEVRSYPHGLDVQVIAWETLAQTLPTTDPGPFQEHVGWYVRRHAEQYKRQDIIAPPGMSNPYFRITLDYAEDYNRIVAIYSRLYPHSPDFTSADILAFASEMTWLDFP
jgi:spore coat polysaccharide biosynthesis protein SpsF